MVIASTGDAPQRTRALNSRQRQHGAAVRLGAARHAMPARPLIAATARPPTRTRDSGTLARRVS